MKVTVNSISYLINLWFHTINIEREKNGRKNYFKSRLKWELNASAPTANNDLYKKREHEFEFKQGVNETKDNKLQAVIFKTGVTVAFRPIPL